MPALLRPSGPDDGFTLSPRSQPPGPCGFFVGGDWVSWGNSLSDCSAKGLGSFVEQVYATAVAIGFRVRTLENK